MTAPRSVLLDNEAVQALIDPRHTKHRRSLALIEATAAKNQRRAGSVRLVVPTAVRVEAGWDRTASRAAAINLLRVGDHALDHTAANQAASIKGALGVSVADAHLGATLVSLDGPVAVITSDTEDAMSIADHLGLEATIVRL